MQHIEGRYIPGQMSRGMIRELGRLQSAFLDEITASEETTKKAHDAWPDYYSTPKRG